MTSRVKFSAVLLAAALGGASVAYAATGAGMSTAPMNPQASPLRPEEPAANKATTAAVNPAAGSVNAEATTTKAMQPTIKTPAKPKIHYIAFSDRVSAKDIAAFGSSKLALDKAISSAEHELNGKAVEAVFKAAPRQPHYVVWVMKNDRVFTTWVDPESAKVTTLGDGVPFHKLYAGEREEFTKTDHARMGLADAVAFAQKSSGNNPIAASMEHRWDTNAYDIATVNARTLQAVWVSPGNSMIAASK